MNLPHAFVAGAGAAAAVAMWSSAASAATPGRISNVAQLGDCMFRSHRATALRLLNASSVADSDRAAARLKDERTCFAGLPANSALDELLSNYSKGLIRGMIAEAALRSSASASTLPARPLQQKRYLRPWFVTTGRDVAVDEMSTCVADADPHGILALIATEPNSFRESYTLGDLQPWLAKCLSAGSRVEADRIALRAALADALYQRLRNPALSEAPPKNPEASK